MGKRFTATDKWGKAWFRQLPPRLKALWFYLCDSCDAAGVIEMDWQAATFQIGEAVSVADVSAFGFHEDGTPRVFPVSDTRLAISRFIAFQYGCLRAECHPHRAVLSLLEKHGLIELLSKGTLRVGLGYLKGTLRVQDKDKDKDQDKSFGKGGVGETPTLENLGGGENSHVPSAQSAASIPPNVEPTSGAPTPLASAAAQGGSGSPEQSGKGKKSPTPKSVSPYSVDFEAFWDAYPRRTGKGKAYEAWLTLLKHHALPELPSLLASVELHKADPNWQKESGQFIPYPATFLHQRRFDDDLQTQGVQGTCIYSEPVPDIYRQTELMAEDQGNAGW